MDSYFNGPGVSVAPAAPFSATGAYATPSGASMAQPGNAGSLMNATPQTGPNQQAPTVAWLAILGVFVLLRIAYEKGFASEGAGI